MTHYYWDSGEIWYCLQFLEGISKSWRGEGEKGGRGGFCLIWAPGGTCFILDIEKILEILDIEKKITRCIYIYKVPMYFNFKKISKTSIPSEEGEVLEKKLKLSQPWLLSPRGERSLGGVNLKAFPNQTKTWSFGLEEDGEQ